jgi:hypothetical protein
MTNAAPHLSPRLIAKSIEDLRAWQLPEEGDLASLHRGVLKALLATDALSTLELPLDMRAPRLDEPREITQWELTANLLAQAEATLCGPAYGERMLRLRAIFPGHAAQLERARRSAAMRLRRLRVRVDFVCRGAGQVDAPVAPLAAQRSSLPQ